MTEAIIIDVGENPGTIMAIEERDSLEPLMQQLEAAIIAVESGDVELSSKLLLGFSVALEQLSGITSFLHWTHIDTEGVGCD